MQRFVSTTFVAFAAMAAMIAAPASVSAQSLNPLGYWEYNGNYNSTGSNTTNVVTQNGTGISTASPGLIGTGVSFAGASSPGDRLTYNIGLGAGANVGGTGYNLGQNFTVSGWYKTDTVTTGLRTYIWEGRTDFDLSFGNGASASTAATAYGSGTTPSTSLPVTGNPLTPNQWVQITQVYTQTGANSQMSLYVNGLLFGTTTAVAATNISDTGFNVGNARNGQNRPLDGTVDELGVWNSSLTANEVLRSYRMGESGITLTTNTAMWSPTVTNGEWLSSGTNNNWSLGAATFAGEGNNAASANTQIALISAFAATGATIGIDFADPAAAGNLGLGAVVFNSQSNNLTINNSSSTAGIVTLNGNTVNSIPNTIFSVGNSINTTGSANRNLTVGDGPTGTLGIRLGNTANVIQVAPGRTLTLNAAISERSVGSGITLQGGGTLILGRNSSYTGTTAISAGGAQLAAGTTHATAFTSATGTALTITNSGSTASTTVGGLSFGSGATTLNLGVGTSWNTTIPLLAVNGGLAFQGTTTLNLTFAAVPGSGTYSLISYTGSIGGNGYSGLSYTPPTGTGVVYTLFDNSANSRIELIVSATRNLKWTGVVDSNWDLNTTANWKDATSNAPFAYAQGDLVIFDDSAAAATPITVNLGFTATPGPVTFNHSTKDYTLSGSGSIAGAATLSKQGSGSLTILTNNTYTGTTTIEGGNIFVGNGGTTGSLGTGIATIASGATLTFNRSDLNVPVPSPFAGAGNLVFTGTNSFGEESSYTLTGTGSTFSGNVSINNSRVVTATGATPLGTATVTVTPGGQVQLTAGTYSGNFTVGGDGWLEAVASRGAIRFVNSTITGSVTLTANTRLTAFATTDVGTISGQITGNFGLEVTSGVVTAAAGGSTGRVTLSNPLNNFTGGIVSNGGTVIIAASGAAGTAAITMGPNVVSSFGYLSGFQPFLAGGPAASVTIPNDIVVAQPGSITFYNLMKNGTAGSALVLSGVISGGNVNSVLQLDSPNPGDGTTTYELTRANSLEGTLRVNRGAIIISNPAAVGNALLHLQTPVNNTLGNLRFSSSMTFANSVLFTTTGDTIAVNGTDTVTMSGVFTTGTGIAWGKIGTGTLNLGNNNAILGTTTVSAGRLNINNTTGSGTGTGSITVAAAGTLGGNGFIVPATGNTVTITGTIAPGTPTTVGTLTLGSVDTPTAATVNGTLAFALATAGTPSGTQAGSDPGSSKNNLTVFGNLTFGASSNISLSSLAASGFDSAQPYSWTVATATGGITGTPTLGAISGTDFAAVTAATGTFSISQSTNAVYVNYTPVPEPGMLLGLACVGLGTLRFLRGKRKTRTES